mmetsp:Transcript_129165/g.287915  ORF Transcript_129165/g.287915 Transcript_129165/m.287915 type:complete len:486 (-) Transcript_129165:257-1714(-)
MHSSCFRLCVLLQVIALTSLWTACDSQAVAEGNCDADEDALLQARVRPVHREWRQQSNVKNFLLLGGIPGLPSLNVSQKNAELLNATLNALQPGDIFFVPNMTFHTIGGIVVSDLSDVIIQIDGTLEFAGLWYAPAPDVWPRTGSSTYQQYNTPMAAMYFEDCSNITFTSSGQGTLDGGGSQWWGLPGIGYLVHMEYRPILLEIESSTNILIENMFLKDSPKYHCYLSRVVNVEVRNTRVEAYRRVPEGTPTDHNLYQLTAFNTDGFDVNGNNIWIHDTYIWVQDDCIAIKSHNDFPSTDMVFERLTASGIGLSIGGFSGTKVVGPNITWRNIYMPNTYNGIYIKIIGDAPTVTGVTYENITIENASHWPIWIGPAQQADSDTCVLQWPFTERSLSHCFMPESSISDITLRNILVKNPSFSPGVIYGNTSSPMVNITFDNFIVENPGMNPWNTSYYYCTGVTSGVATGSTWPVPPCFDDQTKSRA